MNELTLKKEEIYNSISKIISETPSKAKKNKITAFSKLCESLIDKNVSLKITLIATYMTENGHQMSHQSIYNKNAGKNPYRKIFDLWCDYDAIRQSKKNPSFRSLSNEENIIDESDLKSIEDTALRYRISLLYGELKGLKKQNDLLKQIKEMNIIQSIPENALDDQTDKSKLLDDYEVEIIREFLKSNTFLFFNDDGTLVSKTSIRKDQTLSSQGFHQALIKIIDNHI